MLVAVMFWKISLFQMYYIFLTLRLTCYQYQRSLRSYNAWQDCFLIFVCFQDLYIGQVKGINKEDHGLYILKERPIQAPKQLVNLCSDRFVSSISSTCYVDVWQKRLGHAL